MYPRVHLALDNCFASKRWTNPQTWVGIARDCGIDYLEASADTECDPLYTPPDALADWRERVKAALARYSPPLKVANMYSGHGTYATLGLMHPDVRVRDHIQHRWLDVMIDTAADLGAGLGFFCHAVDQSLLREPERYAEAMDDLYDRLAQLAARAAQAGLSSISVEQMYSPHQPPWTIRGAQELLGEVYSRGSAPFYLTLDVGHAVGQRGFLRPTPDEIETVCAAYASGDEPPDLWWLPFLPVELELTPAHVVNFMAGQGYLFAENSDGDPYAWLTAVGAYSPIIHLQQTDGAASAHRPFTARYNASGIIDPMKVLRALKASYDAPELPGMPPRVTDIYLTIEMFSGTAQRYDHILRDLRETAHYWREAVPEDGLTLDALVS